MTFNLISCVQPIVGDRASAYNIIESNELPAETGQAKPVGWAKQASIRVAFKVSVMPRGGCEPQRLERMRQAQRAHRRGEAACPDNRVGYGPSSDAVRATRQCYPVGSAALTASYGSMDGSANLSCLRAQRPDKVMFSGGFIRAQPCCRRAWSGRNLDRARNPDPDPDFGHGASQSNRLMRFAHLIQPVRTTPPRLHPWPSGAEKRCVRLPHRCAVSRL